MHGKLLTDRYPLMQRARAIVDSISRRRTAAAVGPGSRAAVRLVARRGRLLTTQPAVLAAAMLARARLLEAYTLWPTAGAPALIVPAGDAQVAAWMRQTFEPELRRPFGAATWNAVRAGALLMPGSDGAAHQAAGLALGPCAQRRIACYSVTGTSLSKLICFVFEPRDAAPKAAVKLMPEKGEGARLRGEIEYVEALRRRLGDAPEVTSALPVQPRYTGEVGGEYAVVEPVDPMAPHTGHECRGAALRWLAAFQAVTTAGSPLWGSDDLARASEVASYAWARARPGAREAVCGRLEALNADLVGAPIPSCAVHGDFWRGNIAFSQRSLRVYDWEWAQDAGRPFFDLWTFELAELRQNAMDPSYDPREPLAQAVSRVGDELVARGLPREFARATVAPAIAELTFRLRRATGRPGGNEAGSINVMVAAEKLLLGHD